MAASILLALVSPATALAANTAKFSAVSPASGSYSTANTPKITVTVYDKYGVHGSGAISVTLDGRKVSPTCSYIVAGAFNPSHPDYRRFRLTYQVPSSLALGTHTVQVKIKDRRSKRSTYTWKFSIDDASDPVSFTTLTPAAGSGSEAARPKISATVVSRWDVKGTEGYSMTLDGAPVAESIAYTTSGNYRNFKVSYQVPATLTVGSHQVVLTIHDAAERTTTKSWSFTILAPVPEYTEMPVAGASCGDCHGGYPRAHPMTACTSCHGPGKPVGGRVYTSADQSAHTLSCALDCHGDPWTGPYPHNLGSDCTTCHSPAYPTIPQAHPVDADAIAEAHVSDPSFCTNTYCHAASLTAEHYRTGPNRTRLTCAGCHASTKPLVVAAIANDQTSCDSCHDLKTLVHPDTTTAHAAVGSCVRTGCHVTDVAAIHKGDCSKCHAPGVVPTTNCTTCHGTGAPAGPYHLGAPAAHALTAGGCVAYDCHGVGLGMDASLTHGSSCTACHGSANGTTKDCVTCHTQTLLVIHAEDADNHVAPTLFCTTSDCHGTDVAATHFKNGSARCIACHVSGTTPSTLCTNCHAGDELGVHTGAASAHAITGTRCITSGCHEETDAALLHRAGGVPCATCHVAGATPSLDCETSCHAGGLDFIHSEATGNHTASNATCIRTACHSTNVVTTHTRKDGSQRCIACHKPGVDASIKGTYCQNCHDGSLLVVHASADSSHTAPATFCESGCHSRNVAEIHENGPECVACHKSVGEPSVVCADCHEGTPNEIHTWAVAGHVSYFTGGCLLAGCHPADVTATHVKNGQARCVACHATGVDASILGTSCSHCHSRDITSLHPGADAAHAVPSDSTCIGGPCHASNVGTIHAPSGSGCAACHTGSGTPVATCSSCHTGATDYLHRRGDSAHVAAPGGCVSATCHVTDVSTIHSPGPSCLACHANGVDASIKGTNCSRVGCHPGDLTSRHAERAGTDHNASSGTCVQDGCHGSDAGVNVATLHKDKGCVSCHADGKTASLVCADCHSTDLDILHTRGSAYHTAASTSCDQGNGGKCHVRDVIALHADGPNCAACHAPGTTASNRCADCHTGNFWGGVHVLTDPSQHKPANGPCVTSTCHATDVSDIHKTSSPTNGPGCAPCHRQGNLTIDCQECHTVDMTSRHSVADLDHNIVAGTCANDACHGSDAGANVASLHAGLENDCATCHADGTTPSKVCGDCHGSDPLTYPKHLLKLPSAHKAPAGTCVADGCHGTTAGGVDVVALHGPTNQWAGCPRCHAPGKTPTTDCSASGCHASAPATEHDKFLIVDGVNKHTKPTNTCSAGHCHTGATVTEIHGAANCSPCHGAGKTPVADCNTPECHYSGSFPTIHASGAAPHAITAGTCVSNYCHNQTVDTIHNASGKGAPRCIACHALNGGPATTAACQDCHVNATKPGQLPSPDSTPTAHPTATAADSTHTVAATGCSRSGCHSTNLAAIHATPTTNHPVAIKCAACHASDKTASKVCANCHAADFAPPHPAPAAEHTTPVLSCTKSSCHDQTSVALIHVKDGVGKCLACHADNVTPQLTCTAAPCHGSGAFPPTHPAPEAIHLSSDNCTTACHQTSTGKADVAKIHVTADTVKHCSACHTGTGTPVKTCGTCHSDGTYHLGASVPHAVSGACTGSGCHSTDVGLIHVLKPSGEKRCVQACHGIGVDPAVKGTNCATCHGSDPGHVSAHAECNNCHYDPGHWDWAAREVGAAGQNCYECHGTAGATWHHPDLDCHGSCHGWLAGYSWQMKW